MASIQVDLDEEVLARFREDLLQCIHEVSPPGVIFDLSGLDTLDSLEFIALRSIMQMCSIMGADPVLVGLRPGVVSSLIEAGADVDGLRAATHLDAAYALLEPEPAIEADAGPTDGPDINAGNDVGDVPAQENPTGQSNE